MMDVKEKPDQVEFMDEDMLKLWQKFGPMPGDLRLYGGTGLALYLNHRSSIDFDFATPENSVKQALIDKIPWMKGAERVGGPGMIDATVVGENREIKITFMECGELIPMPIYPPIIASNGVLVAHPIDLVASKMEACISRGAKRDYEDIGEAIRMWPKVCRAAIQALPNRTPSGVARIISTPPLEVAEKLDQQVTRRLHQFARDATRKSHGFER